jgi:hypothetical protein
MSYQRPQVEEVPSSPLVPHSSHPDEIYELEGDNTFPAVTSEEAPVEVLAWPPSPPSPRDPPIELPFWPPSPPDPVPRRVNGFMPGVIRLRDENLQLRQSVEELRQVVEELRQIGEEEMRRFRQELLIIQQQIAALEDRRDTYRRQASVANMVLINLQHNPHLLDADLQNVRQMDWRVQEDLRRVQGENARLQAENARLRIERDRARDSLARVLLPRN